MTSLKIARFFRLWRKKRGQRMTGSWMWGSIGEAMFFAMLCLLGVMTLAIVTGWQLYSPETQVYRIGFGFWVMVAASVSFILTGAIGFFYRIMRVVVSEERRQALATQAADLNRESRRNRRLLPPMIPTLQTLNDSPGTKLTYRLPSARPEVPPLILSSIFALAWNSLVAIFLAIAISGLLRWQPDWLLLLCLPLFGIASYYATTWFFRNFRRVLGSGQTSVEISDLPITAGGQYDLYVVQYGRAVVRRISVSLVCEEQVIYQEGTDIRTEKHEIFRNLLLERGRCRIDFGLPLELQCSFEMPNEVMHSFQSPHNAVLWKIVVEGEAHRWPSYCRNFPVVVYPTTLEMKQKQV